MFRNKLWAMGLVFFMAVLLSACSNEAEQVEPKQDTEEQVVKHLMGETTIQGQPQHVAVLQPFFTDFLLSLDIKPGAAVSAGPDTEDEFTWYLKDQLKETKNIGWQVNPVMESILAVKPDLILSSQIHKEAYENLGKIAPTLLIEQKETKAGVRDWRSTFLETAFVFQKEVEANKVIQEYDAKVAKAKAHVEKAIGDETVMFLRLKGKELRYYGGKNMDVLYNDLGVTPPPYFPASNTDKTFEPVALEKFPEINPDHIFLLNESDEKYKELQSSPIWNSLKAVQKKQVYEVDYDLWQQGFGPIASNLMLEQAEEFLTK